jgi:hemolysin activation/secretion protein
LRHSFTDKLQGLAFYDAGTVHINRQPYNKDPNIRSLAGAGLGINADWLGMQIKSALAWRTRGGAALAEPTSVNRNPRLWVQVGRQF